MARWFELGVFGVVLAIVLAALEAFVLDCSAAV